MLMFFASLLCSCLNRMACTRFICLSFYTAHDILGKTVSNNSDMAEVKFVFREVLPKQGQLSVEDITTMVLCKPKLLPLKSLTLEKLEKMQQAANDTIRQQEMAEKEQQQITH
ncbi:BBSome-interacting protein 1 isoform 1-T1 [Hipposideros larvatus]|uniref:BBSome-interacting protein 1 isoform X1 n=2 Tax=Hipposideros armiger TaxID=186990 RepID=A0A8B7RPB8_HIPAR|nr:PREDICTED: BBSome-interacting protein 1 isoform X1 [Hipposideros armiger]